MARKVINHQYFAVCPPGVEDALFAEIKREKFSKAERQVGGCRFSGPPWEGWRAVLSLRCAVRVYRQINRFRSLDAEQLYKGAVEIGWEKLMTPESTFSVEAKGRTDALVNSKFIALKLKDGLVDRMRDKFGARPSVDTRNPDFRIFAHVAPSGACSVSVDLGGKPLNRRGYRKRSVEAPVSETLAAAAIEYSGWDGVSPFLDPMCGSGTLVIEAGMRAANIAPGLLNPDFAFVRMPDFEPERWEGMLEEARNRVKIPAKLVLQGSDTDPDAVTAARVNAEAAGLAGCARFVVDDVDNFHPKKGWGATVISNPPYGIRLDDERKLIPFFEKLGALLRERCGGYRILLFLPNKSMLKPLALKPLHYYPMSHGGLDVRLYSFDINR